MTPKSVVGAFQSSAFFIIFKITEERCPPVTQKSRIFFLFNRIIILSLFVNPSPFLFLSLLK
jgi:hypothetical protein